MLCGVVLNQVYCLLLFFKVLINLLLCTCVLWVLDYIKLSHVIGDFLFTSIANKKKQKKRWGRPLKNLCGLIITFVYFFDFVCNIFNISLQDIY